MPKAAQQATLDVEATVEEVTEAPASPSNQIDKSELEYFNQLSGEFTQARQSYDQLQRQLEEQRSEVIRKEGALSSYSDFLKKKYEIADNDRVDIETGAITRA